MSRRRRKTAARPLAATASAVARDLLAWYDVARRALPWRYAPGARADPYRVWLSEIMLQQTVAKTVMPYFDTFTRRWPTVEDLAAAPLDDVLAAWAGLGYYARARNLYACAQTVVSRHDGRFPDNEPALQALPGIGPYTAAAIMAIAFGRKATPIDGNIERVVARLAAITEPVPGAKPAIAAAARALTPDLRAGDFAQALMDLGAGVCTPRAPGCLACPIAAHCRGRRAAIAASLPRKAAKVARPVRRAIAFVVLRSDGAVLLRRRPETGLLGGMLEVPSSVWHSSEDDFAPALNAAPVAADWTELDQPVVHVFTHFRLELRVLRAEVAKRTPLRAEAEPSRCRWWPRATLADAALPSVMRKVLAAALA